MTDLDAVPVVAPTEPDTRHASQDDEHQQPKVLEQAAAAAAELARAEERARNEHTITRSTYWLAVGTIVLALASIAGDIFLYLESRDGRDALEIARNNNAIILSQSETMVTQAAAMAQQNTTMLQELDATDYFAALHFRIDACANLATYYSGTQVGLADAATHAINLSHNLEVLASKNPNPSRATLAGIYATVKLQESNRLSDKDASALQLTDDHLPC